MKLPQDGLLTVTVAQLKKKTEINVITYYLYVCAFKRSFLQLRIYTFTGSSNKGFPGSCLIYDVCFDVSDKRAASIFSVTEFGSGRLSCFWDTAMCLLCRKVAKIVTNHFGVQMNQIKLL